MRATHAVFFLFGAIGGDCRDCNRSVYGELATLAPVFDSVTDRGIAVPDTHSSFSVILLVSTHFVVTICSCYALLRFLIRFCAFLTEKNRE